MPDWKHLIRRQLAVANLDPAHEANIVEEFAQHAEDRYEELRNGGCAELEAQQIALEELGDRAALASNLRSVTPHDPPEPAIFGGGLFRDVRYGIRGLIKSPGFTTVVLAVLGIGIGANVAMFTVIDAAFLRPLKLPEPERLVQIQESPPSGGTMPVAYPDFLDWEKRSHSFEAMGIAGVFRETLKGAGGNEPIQVGYASAGFLRAYGVKAAAGRMIEAADDSAGGQPVVVLSHAFWESHFGGDPGVIGRSLVIDDRVLTVSGVAAPFRWQRSADVFVPITLGATRWGFNMREQHGGTGVIGRLKRGVSIQEARTEMREVAAQLAKEYPGSNGGISATVVSLREYISGGIRNTALLMFGAVGLLLLVACANVAGLLLARAAVRQREIGIRIALGATRMQLIRQLLTESLLLAMGGAITGVAVAWLGLAGLRQIFPVVENLGGIDLDFRVLAFSILAAAVTSILFGLTPAIQLTRTNVAGAVNAGGRNSQGSAVRLHTRKILVVSQVALAVVLSIGTGLLMRSLFEVLKTEPGFRPEHVVIASVEPPARNDIDITLRGRLLRDAAERLAATPGVQSVGYVDGLPFDNSDSWGDFYREDRPIPAAGKIPNAMKAGASATYFQAMGIPLLKGRMFTAADGRMPTMKRDLPAVLDYLRTIELVAVINDTMARRFWPGEEPIGKAFRFGPPSIKGPRVRIIGVVGDNRQLGLDHPVESEYFFSAEQFPVFEGRLVVRTVQDVPALASIIRAVVAEVQADAVVTSVQGMDTLIDRSLSGRQNNAVLLGLFSALTLLLAALGLYATMAYIVAQRRQEIGVRMALGAAGADIRSMVVQEGGKLAVMGVVIGLMVALVGARVVSSMLYGVTTTDALTYAGSAALLIVVMLAASYIPAWRASRVDPMTALHCE